MCILSDNSDICRKMFSKFLIRWEMGTSVMILLKFDEYIPAQKVAYPQNFEVITKTQVPISRGVKKISAQHHMVPDSTLPEPNVTN